MTYLCGHAHRAHWGLDGKCRPHRIGHKGPCACVRYVAAKGRMRA